MTRECPGVDSRGHGLTMSDIHMGKCCELWKARRSEPQTVLRRRARAGGRAMTHQCPGPGCEAEVDSSMLMCPGCWYQVPSRSARPCGVPGSAAPVRAPRRTGRP